MGIELVKDVFLTSCVLLALSLLAVSMIRESMYTPPPKVAKALIVFMSASAVVASIALVIIIWM